MLSLRDAAADPKQAERWAALGGRSFSREARLRDEGKEPVVLAFPNPLDRDATTALRAAGLRFNKLLQHWEGLARFEDAAALAEKHGGTARRVPGSTTAPAA